MRMALRRASFIEEETVKFFVRTATKRAEADVQTGV
jgi:hypothetical protein